MMKPHLGIHLIDVLISLFLLSIALIGIDAMLLNVSKDAQSLYYLHVGMQQLLQLHEQEMTKNHSEQALQEWNQQNQKVLPNGHGTFKSTTNQLTLNWNQGTNKTCDGNTTRIHCLTLDVRGS